MQLGIQPAGRVTLHVAGEAFLVGDRIRSVRISHIVVFPNAPTPISCAPGASPLLSHPDSKALLTYQRGLAARGSNR